MTLVKVLHQLITFADAMIPVEGLHELVRFEDAMHPIKGYMNLLHWHLFLQLFPVWTATFLVFLKLNDTVYCQKEIFLDTKKFHYLWVGMATNPYPPL